MESKPQELLSPDESREWKQRILRSYLKHFFVAPLPAEQETELTKIFLRNPSPVIVLVTPTLLQAQQTAQCFLLAFGRELDWESCSSHELVRTFFEVNDALSSLVARQVVILTHGFDSLPNKETANYVNQVASSRESRGRKTLILVNQSTVAIKYPVTKLEGPQRAALPSSASALKTIKHAKQSKIDPRAIG